MAIYICPSCQARTLDDDGREGLGHQPVGCDHCGFGFIFEILDDYFPRAGAGIAVADREGRVIASGQGMFELTGRLEADLLGKPVVEALGLDAFEGADPVSTSLEWGVRQLDQKATLTHRAGTRKPVIADVFPGLDDDGGVLVAVAPDLGE